MNVATLEKPIQTASGGGSYKPPTMRISVGSSDYNGKGGDLYGAHK